MRISKDTQWIFLMLDPERLDCELVWAQSAIMPSTLLRVEKCRSEWYYCLTLCLEFKRVSCLELCYSTRKYDIGRGGRCSKHGGAHHRIN